MKILLVKFEKIKEMGCESMKDKIFTSQILFEEIEKFNFLLKIHEHRKFCSFYRCLCCDSKKNYFYFQLRDI